MSKWLFLCKCGDGSAFFEHKVTGEIMCWRINKRKLSISGRQYFNYNYPFALATKANQFKVLRQ